VTDKPDHSPDAGKMVASEPEPVAIPGVDPQVMLAAAELDAEQKANPEWLWYGHDIQKLTFGPWQKQVSQAPYIRADLLAAALLAAEHRGRESERQRAAKIADEASQLWLAGETSETKTAGLGARDIAAAIRNGE